MCKEKELYLYLLKNHKGRSHSVHSKELEERFNLCPRTVRKYINNLRKSGKAICSDEKGYWIALSPNEVDKTIKRLNDFTGEIDSAKTGLAYASIHMHSVTTIRQENIKITVMVD